MRILLTGANGYIGKRLLPLLVEQGHEVVCLVRDPRRFYPAETLRSKITVLQGDLLQPESLTRLPAELDAAYYLVHSMGSRSRDFYQAEADAARNFNQALQRTACRQVIYLSGIANGRDLSKHLASRKNVEQLLQQGCCPATILRAAIIIGSGSASFEIIRDLVEKLPVMIAPKWLNSYCQPIAIRDVLFYLTGVLGNSKAMGRAYDIGGPDILTYKQMLLQFAEVRGLWRYILSVPVLSIRLSTYWLTFVTSTTYVLAKSLAESLRHDVVMADHAIDQVLPHTCLGYRESIRLAFSKIEQNAVISSWTDALISGSMPLNYMDFVQIPEHGVLTDKRISSFTRSPDEVMANIFSIGGERGWYQSNWLWKLRGLLDKLVGGVGLSRPRRSPTELSAGDAVDFWRVLVADREQRRLLLYAEMKVPGEAWLQFRIYEEGGLTQLEQFAAFRPNGLPGRLYWLLLLPFHGIIFKGMLENIISYQVRESMVQEPAKPAAASDADSSTRI